MRGFLVSIKIMLLREKNGQVNDSTYPRFELWRSCRGLNAKTHLNLQRETVMTLKGAA